MKPNSLKICHSWVKGCYSQPIEVRCGVPHWSIPGPILFSLYMSNHGKLIAEQQDGYHFYAGDTQTDTFECEPWLPGRWQEWREAFSWCIHWWAALKMNEQKTKFLVISFYPSSHFSVPSTSICDHNIHPSSSLKDITGFTLDSHLTMPWKPTSTPCAELFTASNGTSHVWGYTWTK